MISLIWIACFFIISRLSAAFDFEALPGDIQRLVVKKVIRQPGPSKLVLASRKYAQWVPEMYLKEMCDMANTVPENVDFYTHDVMVLMRGKWRLFHSYLTTFNCGPEGTALDTALSKKNFPFLKSLVETEIIFSGDNEKEMIWSHLRKILAGRVDEQFFHIDMIIPELRGTLLHWAAEKNLYYFTLILLKKNANVNQLDPTGQPPLQRAVIYGFSNIVYLLVQHPNIQVDIQNQYFWSLMHDVAYRGHDSILRLILHQHRPNINIQTVGNGETPAMVAIERYHFQTALTFIQSEDFNPSLRNSRGYSYLHLAVSRKAPAPLIDLLLSKSEPNILNNGPYHQTILHFAVSSKDPSMVAKIASDPRINIGAVDVKGYTALHLAASNGCDACVPYLLDKISDEVIMRRSRDGFTALQVAMSYGCQRIAAMIYYRIHGTPLTDSYFDHESRRIRHLYPHLASMVAYYNHEPAPLP